MTDVLPRSHLSSSEVISVGWKILEKKFNIFLRIIVSSFGKGHLFRWAYYRFSGRKYYYRQYFPLFSLRFCFLLKLLVSMNLNLFYGLYVIHAEIMRMLNVVKLFLMLNFFVFFRAILSWSFPWRTFLERVTFDTVNSLIFPSLFCLLGFLAYHWWLFVYCFYVFSSKYSADSIYVLCL